MQIACCIIGTSLLLLSVILCWITDNEWWRIVLILGEIVAFIGYAPAIFRLKFFG